MTRHIVTVMTTVGGLVTGASYCATCSTCGWHGDCFAVRDMADAEARHHCGAAKPAVFESATQATTDRDGEAAERRHLATRETSVSVEHGAARREARARIEAALGDSEHQEALDAEIDRHLAGGAT